MSSREVLTIVESLYDLILSVEQVKRDQPLPEEEQEKHDNWCAFHLTTCSSTITHFRSGKMSTMI